MKSKCSAGLLFHGHYSLLFWIYGVELNALRLTTQLC